MEKQTVPANDLYPPDPLGCEPGETFPIFINTYVCPFCGTITPNVTVQGVSTEFYAVDEDGTLYRRFDPENGTSFSLCGCSCGRGLWIPTEDRFNIAAIWENLEEDIFDGPDSRVLQ